MMEVYIVMCTKETLTGYIKIIDKIFANYPAAVKYAHKMEKINKSYTYSIITAKVEED